MSQRLQDTDAYILMAFVGAVRHLRPDKAVTMPKEHKEELVLHIKPAHRLLMGNGHAAQDASDLLINAFASIPYPSGGQNAA